ncbi:MAG: Plug domain-containing protein, partial [Burkholderiales bacterium]|nr:Plug domain-containing protein [Burkholderiales bacterium]
MKHEPDNTPPATGAGPGASPCPRLRIAAAAVMCLSALPLMAQQVSPAEGKNVFTLGTVQVYGQAETAAEEAESVVDRDTIELLEKKDIGTALKLVPGVSYNPPGGGRYESNVYVRGYDLKAMPIFLDGIPVYIPYDGYSDLGRFTTADVASIQVA